jgi:hypothetical protein
MVILMYQILPRIAFNTNKLMMKEKVPVLQSYQHQLSFINGIKVMIAPFAHILKFFIRHIAQISFENVQL